MGKWTVYAQEDTGHVAWVEIYKGEEIEQVHEGASSWAYLNLRSGSEDDVVVVFVDWDGVQALDAGGIETIAELVSTVSQLPKGRHRDALETIETWLEVNEPEDHDGNEELWMSTIQRVADRLALLR